MSDMAAHQSIWRQNETANRSGLEEDLRCDVCVVGAGIAGLSTAYSLAKERLRVVVIDKGTIGGGETLHTTAHLATSLDDRYHVIRALHGEQGAKMCAASHAAAIDCIESVVTAHRIDCDFERVSGYLFLPPGAPLDELQTELSAARAAGAEVEAAPRVPWPDYEAGPCLRFARQGQINAARYMAGLARAFEEAGGRIFCGTEMKGLARNPLQITTQNGRTVSCHAVVLATNTPSINRVSVHIKQAAYRTYALALRVPAGYVPHGLYWDTRQRVEDSQDSAYHYVRVASLDAQGPTVAPHGEEVLIVGGEDHRTGQEDDGEARWNRLEAWARERFPKAGDIECKWSGQVWEPADHVAFIGRNPNDTDEVYIVTGDSGMGMTHGAIAGLILPELIEGRTHPWSRLYDPARVTLRSGDLYQENINTAAQYMDWLKPGDVESVEEIRPGCGALVRSGLALHAVYRDDSGSLHECSAVCPHLGGIVHWNSAEATWDCPCHGSRFDVEGRVLTGPATAPLTVLKPQATDPVHKVKVEAG